MLLSESPYKAGGVTHEGKGVTRQHRGFKGRVHQTNKTHFLPLPTSPTHHLILLALLDALT